jgi:hypothetical protein
MRQLLVLAAAAFSIASCVADDRHQTAKDDLLVLSASVPRLEYQPTEVIEITTTLRYIGPEREVDIRGIDTGLISLWFKQLDGPLEMSPGSNLMCSKETTSMTRDREVQVHPFWSTGYSADDPNAAFYERWQHTPEIRLPAGTWQAVALLTTCGGVGPGDSDDHLLRTEPLVLTVAP